ncbi:hypothetical protein MAR621_03147 [Maribacter dokdonensis]|uniref:hypothetical protein n=1 Tax=Maribacter dokdonensis TaxID=320912 RepID=UPI001AFD90AB|nr:hypothetical protein [Maribacter dokdonensis]CAG2532953.1 hypothetical protein MAR621_03147 [Maribacter dokdonensis]
MTTHYLIHSNKTGRTLKVSYKGGNFFRLELVKGKKLQKEEILLIGRVVPVEEASVADYIKVFPSLDYTKVEAKQSMYQQYVSTWFAFYQKYRELPPRFNAADGKHIVQIKKYLTRLSDQDQEGLELFKLILDNWHKLDQFHQDNTDLKYINSRLNPILNAIKKAGKTGTAGTDNSVSI